ncbi:MAG: transglutaminase domain-containing protein [Muribaculaceae bacterium]|nr:transglutaminase domain-containing protein [Muribaculaceae bacterium]
MKKLLFTIVLCAIGTIISFAENVVIKKPNFFDSPIRDNYILFPDSLVCSSEAEEITIPDVGMIGRFEDYGFKNLKKVSFGNIDYVPSGLFRDNATIEEIEFNGIVGHFDCTLVSHCPNLRKVVFRGPVSSTGGPTFAFDCPQLDSVIFENVVDRFNLNIVPTAECPKLEEFTNNGAFLNVWYENLTPKATVEDIIANHELIKGLEQLAEYQCEVLRATNPKWMRKWQYFNAKELLPYLEQINSEKAKILKEAIDYAWNVGDDVKSELEVLKESPSYQKDSIQKPKFVYAQPTDSLLRLTRERFNLDSIAGNGDDISRIKNLMYWVHDNIEHDGHNDFPRGPRNMRNIYDSSKRDSCGYNCRALAISLTEALLAEGIPARYITCESKKWDTDYDCHVICVAWSNSLNKWIWVDPTFAAYVTDEKGLLLHPGEVRYRLQNDLPLVLNEDANWNHRNKQTKEDHLDHYMAKNLYIMSINTINQAEPEGETDHPKGQHVALVPLNSNYTNADIITTDDEWFWQAPEIVK